MALLADAVADGAALIERGLGYLLTLASRCESMADWMWRQCERGESGDDPASCGTNRPYTLTTRCGLAYLRHGM